MKKVKCMLFHCAKIGHTKKENRDQLNWPDGMQYNVACKPKHGPILCGLLIQEPHEISFLKNCFMHQ